MNRAWIPAGALAGVSVAGLIALGPLTKSLVPSDPFPTSIPVTSFGETSTKAVPVSVNYKQVGRTHTETAALSTRGGEAAAEPATDSTAGQVGYRRHVVVTTKTPAKTVVTPAKPKKPVKRASSIGTTGEANGDSGLAGGSSDATSVGEQVPTPSSDR